ncbi:uncharacterized protein LOC121697482 isoform X2 [Alosa sapidissima]|uniref:uncharacterized protein LOC121697482 isoform X2 n=1 Tax=Alosa sapidissima TaxID=34773 RepID=UPI001C08A748|nr:uncharacterized protein LOC121697482 isoform X2 [Alosa sapidissima]
MFIKRKCIFVFTELLTLHKKYYVGRARGTSDNHPSMRKGVLRFWNFPPRVTTLFVVFCFSLKTKCSAAIVNFHICSKTSCLSTTGFIIGKQTTDLTTYRRSAVLRGLPLYLREPASISKTIKDTEALGPHTKAMKMGILEVTDSSTNSGPYPTVVNVAVVLEEEVVMDNLGDFTNALMMLFGLLYALNMEYPKDLRYTFEAVQKILLNLGKECTARIQSFKNKLLQV